MRLALGLLFAAACGGAPKPPPGGPDYRPVATTAPPARATLYADCLADAAAHHRFARAHDPSTNLLVFTCTGAPARAFYDALATWSHQIGSELTFEGRTLRSTAKVRRDLFGVDYCATDGTDHTCVITLNVGDFVQ